MVKHTQNKSNVQISCLSIAKGTDKTKQLNRHVGEETGLAIT